MDGESGQVYQFKITLKYSSPKIWRRIQVNSSFSFKELHYAIQNAMGWRNAHLHKFEINGKTISTPFIDASLEEMLDLDEEKTYIKDYFKVIKQKAEYEYDYGDSWCHVVELEKIEQAKQGEKYPKCIAGKRACPPEDCGGPGGYEELLDIIKNPSCEDHNDRMEWLENCGYTSFDPAKFSHATAFDSWAE